MLLIYCYMQKEEDHVQYEDTKNSNTIIVYCCTYFFKSYIVILLPTGLMTDIPSGVKRRSPSWYTEPSRLLNYKYELIN